MILKGEGIGPGKGRLYGCRFGEGIERWEGSIRWLHVGWEGSRVDVAIGWEVVSFFI